jgi:putative copper export protein
LASKSTERGGSVLAYSTGIYYLLKFIHLTGAAFWVGTAFAVQVLVTRMLHADDPHLASFAKDIGWMGKRVLAPLSGGMALFGVILVIYAPQWTFGTEWILIGIAGFLATLITGSAFLGPESERLGKLVDERSADDPEIRRRISRILAISRIDLVVLVLVIADMVFKPGS